MIQILNKKQNKIKYKNQKVLAHEHLNFDLRKIRKDNTSFMKNKKLILSELNYLENHNVGLIVELSNQSMHSNKNALLEIQKKSGIDIVASTGYYLNEYEKNNSMSVKEIETEFYNDIVHGFKLYPNIKAGIIGEIATSSEKIFSFEKKVFKAAVRVQKKLGVAIYTHVNLGDNSLDQMNLLNKLKAIPQKTIIGHQDLVENISVLKKILNNGFIIGFDTIGKQNYLNDAIRAKYIVDLIKEGYENQIVISLDISRQEYLKFKGGYGYDYLYSKFFEKIKNKISKNQWKKISSENILKILEMENN